MNENELVSIIVPIYNAEKYLQRCIESILVQTYYNYELLLIDDGSKDNSLIIAQQYEKKDKRIHVFHQENKGVSCARNFGINKAIGKYLSFVDADDWVKDNFIETLVVTIQGAELAIVEYNILQEEIKPVKWRESGCIDRETFFFEILCNIRGSCCDKLFLNSIVKDRSITFAEDVYFSEDTLFMMNYYRFCDKVKYCNQPLYQYTYNSQSATHISKRKEFNMKRITLLTLSDKIEEWYKNENEFIKNCINYRRVRTYIYLIFHMIKCKDYQKEIAKRIHTDIKKYYCRFVKFEKTPLIQKIAATVICISPRITYLLGIVGQNLVKNVSRDNYIL